MAAQIKVGLVGIGRAGWNMHKAELDGFQDKFKVVAACDTDFARTQPMVDALGCRAYADFGQLLQDPEVELVSIAAPSAHHVAQARRALKAGKYVFLEKPIAITGAGARQLQKAAAQYPGQLYFRHNRRFEPAFQHIREIMATGVLGRIAEIQLRRYNYQLREDWQTLLDCGGGQLNNWGPHLIDHALRLLESPVKEIWSDLQLLAARGDAEDHFKAILKGENGRLVDVEVSSGAALPLPEYTIIGTRGALICAGDEIQLNHLAPEQAIPDIKSVRPSPALNAGYGNAGALHWQRSTVKVAPAAKCEMHHIWQHLYAAIREGQPFPITTEEAVEVVLVSEKIRRRHPQFHTPAGVEQRG